MLTTDYTPMCQTDDNFLGIIIPVYNGSKYLEQAVHSILSQPCKDAQAIIVNDGSIDSSLQIALGLASEDKRVTVLNQANRGVSSARNTGLDYCLQHGFSYIGFLDSDDIWIKDFFTPDLKKQMIDEGLDAYRFSWYTANETMTRFKVFPVEHNKCFPAKSVRFGSPFCSFLYRAEVFSKYGIRFPEGIHAQEDETFRYIFLTIGHKIKSINIPIFAYRSNSLSVCHVNFDASRRYFEDILPAWEWAENELKRLIAQSDSVTQSDLNGCATMRKTFLSEYIETACFQGLPKHVITQKIHSPDAIHLYEDSSIWVSPACLTRWEKFHKSPTQFWLKHRMIGFFTSLLRRMRNLKFIQKKRYPETIIV